MAFWEDVTSHASHPEGLRHFLCLRCCVALRRRGGPTLPHQPEYCCCTAPCLCAKNDIISPSRPAGSEVMVRRVKFAGM
eukprot:3887509-Pyramimonas_sp.AAC.1